MASRKLVIGGGAAMAALFARLRRKPPPEPEPEDEPWDDVAAEEMDGLREELRQELDRLAGADIKASRTPRGAESPPG